MLRTIVFALLLAGCASTKAGTSPPTTAFTADDRHAIAKVLFDQRDAWNAGDIEGFMAGYVPTDELLFTSGAKLRRGFAATRTRYRERYVDGGAMGRLAFSELEIHGLGPDAAWVLGRWALTDTPEAGSGVFTLVFVRRQGRWAILHDHTSAEAAVCSGAMPPSNLPARTLPSALAPALALVAMLGVACDNSDRNERIADVQKKPPEEDPEEKAKAEARKAKRLADEKAKADAEEAVRVEIAKIAVLPEKLPKKLDEACQGVADAHDGFMQRVATGDALAAWNASKENEMPMTFVQCAGADSIPAAACQKAALDAASPALADHFKEILATCIAKFAPARPAAVAGGAGGGIPAVPKKGPR